MTKSNEIENRIKKIDQELEDLKGKTTEELTTRLLKSAAEASAAYYLLKGDRYLSCSRKKAPVPLPALDAQTYRDEVERLIGAQIPVKDQISTLRQKRQELRAQAPQRARESIA